MLDSFTSVYREDGGCDEGPGYWSVAGGALYTAGLALYDLTGGYVNIFDDPLVKSMGEYAVKVVITDRHVLNFADSTCRTMPIVPVVYDWGMRCGSEMMITFAQSKMGGKLPAAQSDAFANIAEMTVGGGADADAVGTISGSQTRTWKAAGDGFFQLQARCQNPAGTTLKLELLDGNGSIAAVVTPQGTLGNADGLRRFIWTVPVRGGDSVRLTMSAGELTLVKGQFIYFGVPE